MGCTCDVHGTTTVTTFAYLSFIVFGTQIITASYMFGLRAKKERQNPSTLTGAVLAYSEKSMV